jgi:DNA-binding CsgD family transcriptional regulator
MRFGGNDMDRGHKGPQDAGPSANQEVWDIVKDLELSMALINPQTARMEAATEAFLKEVGRDASDVVDHPVFELFASTEEPSIRSALDALSNGKVEFYRTHRVLHRPHAKSHTVSIWMHVIDFGAERYGLCELSRVSDDLESPLVKFLGHPAPTMAFGMADENGIVTTVSDDVSEVLGVAAHDLIGKPLLRGAETTNAWRLLDATPGQIGRNCISLRLEPFGPKSAPMVRCILTSFVKSSNFGFILIPETEKENEPSNDRVVELERSLWKIASEVQASGIFEHLWSFPDAQRFPQLNSLSSRQWEVLSRLLRGQRVQTIAQELFVSESTVRNSLSTIFHKFGVHSKAELLKLLQSDPPPTS